MPQAQPRRDGTLDPAGSPRYDTMFAGRLLSAVIGVGFDEDGTNRAIDDQVERGLTERGFVRNDPMALDLLAYAGRALPRHPAPHFVRPGEPDTVLTLVRAGDGTLGADAATAFIEGLDRCDLAAYAGHGRYGTGPDFDYNFTADLVDEKGEVTASFRAYKDLEEELTERGRPTRRSALAVYRDLVAKRRLVIRRVNGGNVVINLRNYHGAEFGSHLMIDQLKTDPGIRRASQQHFEKRYRLWAFNGCRTSDYLYNLRALNPQANAGGLDLIATRRVCYWSDVGPSALALLDGVLARKTFKALLDDLAAVNHHEELPDAREPSHVADVSPTD